MAYECQNFKNGQILTAECLNKIDEWLQYICGKEIVSGEVNANGELVLTLCNGETMNIGAVGGITLEQVTGLIETALAEAKANGVHVGTEAPTDGQTVWIDTDEEPDEEPEESGTKIDVVANVGQVIAVKAVGVDSKPTEFEAVDLPKVTPPDFSANEGEEGYIKNRTHYIDEKGIVHKLSNKYIDADWMATSYQTGGGIIYGADIAFTSKTATVYPHLVQELGFPDFDVYWNGVKYPCSVVGKSGNGNEVFLGNMAIMDSSYEDTGEPFVFSGMEWNGEYRFSNLWKADATAETVGLIVALHEGSVYNKLPEEFLPDGVVKSVNGAKPDDKGNVQIEMPENTGVGIPYIVGNSTTAGKWTGECAEITEYYEGLTVLYKLNVAGASGGTTLDINGLGAVAVNRNASTAVTTIYPAGSVLMLTYSDGKWLTADYDANSKNTAGTSNKAATKMFLVGATSQTSSGTTTYTNSGVYIGTDNELYSNGKKVATEEDIPSGGGSGIDVTAEVGQTIVVEEVDGNGKPTKWRSADYQPRTHWSEVVQGDLVPHTAFTPVLNEAFQMLLYSLPSFDFEAGKTYTVIFDGVEYTGTAEAGVYSGMPFVSVGNTALHGVQSTEPFIVAQIPALNVFAVVCFTADEHTIQIIGEKTVHHKIPDEYVRGDNFKIILVLSATGGETYTASATFEEIIAAVKAGKNVFVEKTNLWSNGDELTCRYNFVLSGINDGIDENNLVAFLGFDNGGLEVVSIHKDGRVTIFNP